jgi:hypothetical protein
MISFLGLTNLLKYSLVIKVDLTDQFVEVKQVRPVDFVVLTVSFFEIVVVFLKMLMDLHLK